jgi:hypothetical protein
MTCKEVVVAYVQVLSWKAPEKTEENLENTQDNWFQSRDMNLQKWRT